METAPNKAEPPKRKRRWYQFSLRTLLIVTVLCAIPCAWLGRKIERKRREREAVESITKDGWSVIYDSQIDPKGNQYSSDKPRGPGWLRTVLGENFFSEAKRVYSFEEKHGTKACTDSGLERINELPHLEWVSLAGTHVSDVGLVHINELTELATLDLSNTRVTDAGMEHINGLAQLQSLYLTGTTITDAGLDQLKGLTKLRELRLEGTNVTDAGIKDLKKALPDCEIRR